MTYPENQNQFGYQMKQTGRISSIPSMISQANTTRRNSMVDALIGAEPHAIILMLPPKTALTCARVRVIDAMIEQMIIDFYLAENNTIPESVCNNTSRLKTMHLRCQSPLEQRALQTRQRSRSLTSLENPVQNTWNSRNHIGFQQLHILQ